MEIILGALVSLVIELVKKYIAPLGNIFVIASVAALSIVAAVVYYFVTKNPILWEQVLTIFASAGAVYAFIWHQLDN